MKRGFKDRIRVSLEAFRWRIYPRPAPRAPRPAPRAPRPAPDANPNPDPSRQVGAGQILVGLHLQKPALGPFEFEA